MLPPEWEKKLVDLNVTKKLTDAQIKWADYVFISAMTVQRDSVRDVVAQCNRLKAKVVAGGPLFTAEYDEFTGIDHFVLGEGEVTVPLFLADLAKGCPQHIYTTSERPDITMTPAPMWSLINLKNYSAMSLQYSRGCPFNCEFCDIIMLNGHTPRTKSKEQFLGELDGLYKNGWRASILIVDDNFIGNKRKLKQEILPALLNWMDKKRHPFTYQTEASINIADDDELMDMMVATGFNKVFVGIETPNENSLVECNKSQNTKRDLADCVKNILNHGLEVMGGFIVGFDNDPQSIFKNQINFIQKTGIVTAMVGLLNAPRGTQLYQRLLKEKRLVKGFSGDNTDFSLNFKPKMDLPSLVTGYKHILNTIYAPKEYYARVTTFLKEYKHPKMKRRPKVQMYHVHAVFGAFWLLGVVDKGRWHFWKMMLTTLFRRPKSIAMPFGFAIFGLHFRKVFEKSIKGLPDVAVK